MYVQHLSHIKTFSNKKQDGYDDLTSREVNANQRSWIKTSSWHHKHDNCPRKKVRLQKKNTVNRIAYWVVTSGHLESILKSRTEPLKYHNQVHSKQRIIRQQISIQSLVLWQTMTSSWVTLKTAVVTRQGGRFRHFLIHYCVHYTKM